MPLTLSGNGTISDLASAPTVGGTALPTNLSDLGIANHDQITVDSSGRMTNSSQVVFSATHISPHSLLLGSNVDVAYTNVKTNVGNHYNTTTGVFTCPVAGRYAVMHSQLTYSTGNGFHLMKNGNAEAYSYIATGDGVWNQINLALILDCQANDTINLRGSNVYAHDNQYGMLNIQLIG